MKKIKRRSMGSHHSARMKSDVWLTPPDIIQKLGPFDLDPCSPVNRPWDTAKNHFTIKDDGLVQQWFGRVWLNPPYGMEAAKWLRRMVLHGNGIALIFARTETKMFFDYVWRAASSLLFIEGRLHFHNAMGQRAAANAGAPSVLVSYGDKNIESLAESGIEGAHVIRNHTPIVVVGVSYTWKSVISMSFQKIRGEASIQKIYEFAERLAPEKVRANKNYKAKIRQQLQLHFRRVEKGVYTIA